MSAIRNLPQIIVILGMLLVSACTAQPATTVQPNNPGAAAAKAVATKPPTAPSNATPEPLPDLNPEVKAGMELCAKIVPGQACLVQGPVMVTAQPEHHLPPFKKPGQTLNLADVHTIKLG